ncbi:PREDICTED: probable protein phosphatase 2C 62 isoform X2 [Camelina sativa]|uniref:Probable protein phosphatase 2C 62 isoform X2 n=1 Tax=Camelina sativa TaxID=90675 RepID=A0ABM0UW57_CAMSA|nr:PREDICTED: probable protein phosphatase 2C 62 isoform X2 [Camelina sativa]
MADHLIFSLQAPTFLIFPSLHRPWGFFRRLPGGVRFSVKEFRLSSQLQLAKSVSHSQSLASASSPCPPEKFDLVSTTQLKDGSYVFRFGDASEIEKYLEAEEKARCVEEEVEKKQHANTSEEASEVSRKQRVKDLDPVPVLKEKSDAKKEESAAPSNLSSNVIKIKDRKRVRAPTKKKKETLISVNVSRSQEDKVETKLASVSNLSSIATVAEAIPTSSTEENAVVSEESEPVAVEPLSSKVMETVSVNKIGDRETNGYQQITENRMEVQTRPRSSSSQHGSQSHGLEEVVTVSTVEIDDNLAVREKPVGTIEAEENLVVEPTATAAVFPDEFVSTPEATPSSVDEIAQRPVSSEENPMKSFEAEEDNLAEPGSQSQDLEEVAPVYAIEIDDNLAVREKPVKNIEAEENLVVEPTDTAAAGELISTSEAIDCSVDEIAQKPVIDTSEEKPIKTFEPEENILVEPEATHLSNAEIAEKPAVDASEENDGENVASTIEDEITVKDAIIDNGSISKTADETEGEDLQVPALETTTLEPIEVASDREELLSKEFYLDSGLASLQRPYKALAGREDAYFTFHHNWIGIADGVSQWSFEGINKGMYSQELMSNCQKIISDETAKMTDPVQVLHRSVNETKSSGSSTALIAHLDNNELHIANIGDTGFIVIRDGTVLQKSSPMFHHFCFPLQITQGCDVLKLAEVYNVKLDEGDVVIVATDGLFDNLYEKEIVSIVCESLEQSLEPQEIAELVAAKAQEVGGSETERTPFADAAKEEGYVGHKGGKLDAVTVIVSFVKTVST